MIGIYKITSPTGKMYIGQSIAIEKRLHAYKNLMCRNQVKLYNSLTKYGTDSHVFEVVEECSVEELNSRERYWQEHYNVVSSGLNCRMTASDDKSGYLSEDTKAKISTYYKNLYQTVEGKEKIKQRIRNTDQLNKTSSTDYKAFQQKRLASTDQISRVRNTDQNAKAKKLWIPIHQCTLEGTIVREWSSSMEAGTVLGISRGNISDCLTGRQKTAKGYIWKYAQG